MRERGIEGALGAARQGRRAGAARRRAVAGGWRLLDEAALQRPSTPPARPITVI
jgi:hypothetical protein